MKKRVVSFSIFGTEIKYLNGLRQNIELIELFYPGWEIFIYYNNTVPFNFLDELFEFKNIKLIDMSHSDLPGMFWRFLPNDAPNVDLFIVRDLDSRISIREVVAVYDWVASGKNLHIMRDHPHHHYKILGGMWGMKRNTNFSMENLIKNYITSSREKVDLYERMLDMDFLGEIIYKKFRFSKMVHASYHKYEFGVRNFVPGRINKSFVGEIIGEDGQRTNHYKFIEE
jgi:hypothetical protein